MLFQKAEINTIQVLKQRICHPESAIQISTMHVQIKQFWCCFEMAPR